LLQAHITRLALPDTFPLALVVSANVCVAVATGARRAELYMFDNLLFVSGFACVEAAVGAEKGREKMALGFINEQKQQRYNKKHLKSSTNVSSFTRLVYYYIIFSAACLNCHILLFDL
jgi:hypothetical protein